MTNLPMEQNAQLMEQVVIGGDLSKLTAPQRVLYYNRVCESLGLNPFTQPFAYIELDGKLTLYARKDATDQLRRMHRISLAVVSRDKADDLYIVTARATDQLGRSDESTGVVCLTKEDGEWKQAASGKRYFQGNGKWLPLKGDALANALMKAETKAKRRATLSLVGLGWMDETEIETVPSAQTVQVDQATGEIEPARIEASKSAPVVEQVHWTADKAKVARFWAWTEKQSLTMVDVYAALGKIGNLSEYTGSAKKPPTR